MTKKKRNAMNKTALKNTLATFVALAFTAFPAMAQSSGRSADEPFLNWLLIAFGLLFLVIIIIMNNVIKGLAGNRDLWKPKGTQTGAKVITLGLMMSAGTAMAASPRVAMIGFFEQYSSTFWLLVAVNLFLAMIILVQLVIFRKLIEALKKQDAPEEVEEEVIVPEEQSAWMKKVMGLLTKAVPVEQEEEVLTDHEYDGIKELDNVLPPWWVAMFYATILFAFVYLVHYHVLGTGDLQIAEYEKSVIKAEKEIAAYMALAGEQVDEKTVTVVTEASRLANGEKIYFQHCVTCHGDEGQGGVGPNFADAYWIHGGSINDIFSIIKYGVPAKGMISWRAQLSPKEMQDVGSFILTFQGTNPPNQKAPEGELYIPEEVKAEIEDEAEITDGEDEPDIPDDDEQVSDEDMNE
jgi:cytochrome c oxidase cbb3-type subunit 3